MLYTLTRKLVNRYPWLRQVIAFVWKPLGQWKFRRVCKGKAKLHIGAGSDYMEGFLNTDILPSAPYYLDATRRFPVEDGSIRCIINRELLEHLTREQGIGFLHECYRVLEDGGVLIISTPDIWAITADYAVGAVSTLLDRNRREGYLAAFPVDVMNKTFCADGHKCLYDFDTLEALLSHVGFSDIQRCSIARDVIMDKYTLSVKAIKIAMRVTESENRIA